MRRGPRWAQGFALSFAAILAGCVGNGPVVRVVDGHVVEGRFIGVEAYGAYLVGAIADESGDLHGALFGYQSSVAADPSSPEGWTRIGKTRCRLDFNDPRADAELTEALRLDPTYEPALAARTYCALLRSQGFAAAEDFARSAEIDPLRFTAGPRGETPVPDEVERRRLEALTLLHGDRVAAWDALATWGLTHGDVTLAARGMVEVAKRAPSRRFALGETAVGLAGAGYMGAAREIAAALLDARGDRSSGGEGKAAASVPLVARLALDEGILAKNAEKVFARSAKAHLGMQTAAARAWAMGNAALARDLVALTAKADPGNLEARIVLEGTEGRGASRLLSSAPNESGSGTHASLTADVALPFACAVLASEGEVAARRVLTFGEGVHVPEGDALLTPIAVELAIAGILAEDTLPPDARIELAARRGAPPDEKDVAHAMLDARHKLLGLALLHPTDAATQTEARRLMGAAPEDPLVAVALARIALAHGKKVTDEERRALEAFAPADPMVAAALVDVVKPSGAGDALTHAKKQLAALARTPSEKARATE